MTKRPNLLLLFTDMQRADTIHALGNEVIRTPHLDRLVREGTAFTNAYTPSPVCVPARCCMHYGLHAARTGLFDNGAMMPDNGASFPAVLGGHGYRTHAVGKCHFTPDPNALRGFQTRLRQEECTSDPRRDDYVAWLVREGYDHYEPHGARSDLYYVPQVSTLPAEAHPTQWVGNESLRFIREQATGDRPWCLFASFIHPHPPFAPPKPWHKLYRVPQMPLPFVPERSQDLMTWVNRFQNRYKYRDRGLDWNFVRLVKAYYYATISFVDFQVGRILQALDEIRQLDDTLILFTSDHGEHLGDFLCFGKRSMHDASARVPMVIRYAPRFGAGRRCSATASLVDVFPTLLGAAGVGSAGLGLDGSDLAAIADNPPRERTVYSQFGSRNKAIYMAVNETWKYVYSAGDRREYLFDRRHDPRETTDVAGRPDCAEGHARMKRDLLDFLRSTGQADAVVETDSGPDWRPYPRVDERYLDDPDSELLFQDYPSYPLDLPGYSSP